MGPGSLEKGAREKGPRLIEISTQGEFAKFEPGPFSCSALGAPGLYFPSPGRMHMLQPNDLIRRVDEQASLDFLAQMIRFKSYSATPGEAELARFMADQLRGLGLEAELQPVEDGRYNAIGTWRG